MKTPAWQAVIITDPEAAVWKYVSQVKLRPKLCQSQLKEEHVL